jgi:hypothetical protein
MPTNLKIIKANEFVRMTAQGTFDLEESKKALADVAFAAKPLTNFEILLDVRKAQVVLSTAATWWLAAELSNLGATFHHKTAVLVPLGDFDEAEFFALCAQNRGFNVRGYVSFEEAAAWLMEPPDSQDSAS